MLIKHDTLKQDCLQLDEFNSKAESEYIILEPLLTSCEF